MKNLFYFLCGLGIFLTFTLLVKAEDVLVTDPVIPDVLIQSQASQSVVLPEQATSTAKTVFKEVKTTVFDSQKRQKISQSLFSDVKSNFLIRVDGVSYREQNYFYDPETSCISFRNVIVCGTYTITKLK